MHSQIHKVGKHTYGTEGIQILWWKENAHLEIGSFCSIAGNLTVYLGGEHRVDWVTTYPFGHINQKIFKNFSGDGHPKTKGNVIIGNDVWIGYNVTILSGVTIGDGAVISASSLVTKSVKPYTVVGGNPAEFLFSRFNPSQVKELLKYKWWELSDDQINKLTPLLCSKNINQLLVELSMIRLPNQPM